jgi:hypothetical protein
LQTAVQVPPAPDRPVKATAWSGARLLVEPLNATVEPGTLAMAPRDGETCRTKVPCCEELEYHASHTDSFAASRASVVKYAQQTDPPGVDTLSNETSGTASLMPWCR